MRQQTRCVVPELEKENARTTLCHVNLGNCSRTMFSADFISSSYVILMCPFKRIKTLRVAHPKGPCGKSARIIITPPSSFSKKRVLIFGGKDESTRGKGSTEFSSESEHPREMFDIIVQKASTRGKVHQNSSEASTRGIRRQNSSENERWDTT